MDTEAADAIRALSDAIRALSAEISALGARVAALDHDVDALFERCADADDADDDDDGARRTCVVDWRYNASNGRFEVLYGTLLEDGTLDPDSAWSGAAGAGPYGGGGTDTAEEDW